MQYYGNTLVRSHQTRVFYYLFDTQLDVQHLQEFTLMNMDGQTNLLPHPNLHIALEQIPGDNKVLDLIRAFVDTGDAEVAVPAFDGHFAGVAHAAVNLHDAVDDAIGHV